ncbi:MAG TPA: hypothetical protein PKW17_13885 [Smithellaceae bacterium]|nr:hypothetical protein [Smithellaceae bacterium]
MNNVILDIKTGKAEPWAALQTAAYALLDMFVGVEFDDEKHLYFYQGNKLDSVTQILQAEGFIDIRWYDDWSRQKGKYVHQAIKYYLADELDESSLDPEIKPYLEAFKKFLSDSNFNITSSERPGISTILKYAGTPDISGFFPNGNRPGTAGRFALELNNKGKYRLTEFKDKTDFDVWRSVVAVYHWKQNNLRRK